MPSRVVLSRLSEEDRRRVRGTDTVCERWVRWYRYFPDEGFVGKLDEVRVYNYAFTAEEVFIDMVTRTRLNTTLADGLQVRVLSWLSLRGPHFDPSSFKRLGHWIPAGLGAVRCVDAKHAQKATLSVPPCFLHHSRQLRLAWWRAADEGVPHHVHDGPR